MSVNSLTRPCKQTCDLNLATALPLQWNPPTTRTEWNKWGSTSQDFALVFSFWTRWTQKHCQDAVKVHTWTQALALFVRYGGVSADFLQQCQFCHWPPEGPAILDHRRDIFSLGLTIQMITTSLEVAKICSWMRSPLDHRPFAQDVLNHVEEMGVLTESPCKRLCSDFKGNQRAA